MARPLNNFHYNSRLKDVRWAEAKITVMSRHQDLTLMHLIIFRDISVIGEDDLTVELLKMIQQS